MEYGNRMGSKRQLISLATLLLLCFILIPYVAERVTPGIPAFNIDRRQTPTILHDYLRLRPIHFIVISNHTEWPRLEACAVLSAARYHPERWVLVHSQHLLRQDPLWYNQTNIKVLRLETDKLLKGTHLITEIRDNTATQVAKSKYWVAHASDAARYILLQRYGGIYLDTDVITVRPFGKELTAGTTVVRQTIPCTGNETKQMVGDIANGVLSAGPRSLLYTKIAEELPKVYKPSCWTCIGPDLVARLASPFNVTVLQCRSFFKIDYPSRQRLFSTDAATKLRIREELYGAYGVHLWRAIITADAQITRQQFVGELMAEHCPNIFSGVFRNGFSVGGVVKNL